jgi:hypothetical protein
MLRAMRGRGLFRHRVRLIAAGENPMLATARRSGIVVLDVEVGFDRLLHVSPRGNVKSM